MARTNSEIEHVMSIWSCVRGLGNYGFVELWCLKVGLDIFRTNADSQL